MVLYCVSFFRQAGRKTRVPSGRQRIENDRQAQALEMSDGSGANIFKEDIDIQPNQIFFE
jgi:hypothetical protein